MNDADKKIIFFAAFAITTFFVLRKRDIVTPIYESVRLLDERAEIIMGGKTCGERNNNPGNLRPQGYTWQGQTGVATCGVSGRFVVFSTPHFGIRALSRDLKTKYNRGLDTIRKIINVYAPPIVKGVIENNTAAYIAQVSKALGIGPDAKLNMEIHHRPFVVAIIKHENGRVVYSGEIIDKAIAAS